MKLGTRVKLAGVITVGVFLVYGAALLYMDRTMSLLAKEVQDANEFRNKISLLRTLALDTLIYPTERSKKQWAAAYSEVRQVLDDEQYRRLQLEYSLGDISDKVKIVGDTFQRLLSLPGAKGLNASEMEIRREFSNRLTTQLMLTTQDLLNRFVDLTEEVNQQLIQTQRLITLLDIVALLALGLIILSAGVFLQRSVLQPVLKLHAGAEIIGGGKLDYKVGLDHPDEIGELSRAFDRMTANLKKVTVSRDDLVREVAERQRAEAALRERSDELARAVAELEETNAEMERFTYMISHDLKSPLVTIGTFLGFLEEDLKRGDTDRITKDINYIYTAAEKMGRLLSELLELSRLGRVVNPPQDVTLQELVQEVLQSVAGPIAARGVEVHVSDDDISLFGDRPRLVEIWQNLVENAVKFMGEQDKPQLTIGLERQEGDTRFFVGDNGIGVEPLYQSRIFGIFEKLNPKGTGTGIGLAVVKRIVELYQGKIWVESAGLGQGACFWFTLPGAVRAKSGAATGE